MNFYVHKGYMDKNIAKNLKTIKTVGNPKKKDIPEKVFKRFRRNIYRGQHLGHILCFELLNCGLRVSELISIELKDVNLRERNSTLAINGKGNVYRTIIISPSCAEAIKNYLPVRHNIPTDSKYLLLSERKQGYSRSGINKLILSYCNFEHEGKLVSLSPHQFRHRVARRLLEESDNNLILTAQYLGHSSVNLLMDYYVNISDETISNVLEQI